MKNFNVDYGYAVLFGVCCGLLAYAFLTAMAMPDVWFSYSTDECVKVINYVEGDNYSCENMPTKFNHVWVK